MFVAPSKLVYSLHIFYCNFVAKAVITFKFRVQKNLFDATPTKVIIAKQKVLIDKLCQKERFKT